MHQDPPWNSLWLQRFPEHSWCFAHGLVIVEKGWVGLIVLPDELTESLSGVKRGQDIFFQVVCDWSHLGPASAMGSVHAGVSWSLDVSHGCFP